MSVRLMVGDCRERLAEIEAGSVHCCVTSPPYFGLRDYGVEGQMGLEPTPDEYVAGMVRVFREVRRVLRDDGTLWVNIGDSYAGSWGAQSRGEAPGPASRLSGGQVYAAPKGTHTGSVKRTPGVKAKDLLGIPWLLAFALRADGWYLRQEIIWSKPNPMPESVRDRCTKAHESIFLLSKSPRYYFDQAAILEPVSLNTHARLSQDVQAQIGSERANGGAKTNGNMKAVGRKFDPGKGNKNNPSFDAAMAIMPSARNKRSVWEVATQPYSEAHFATYPPALIEPCILAGCPKDSTVIDPFGGAGTTALVADRLQRDSILIELNPDYAALAESRIRASAGMFAEIAA